MTAPFLDRLVHCAPQVPAAQFAIVASTRSCRYAVVASAYGPPPDAPATKNRCVLKASAIWATSSADETEGSALHQRSAGSACHHVVCMPHSVVADWCHLIRALLLEEGLLPANVAYVRVGCGSLCP